MNLKRLGMIVILAILIAAVTMGVSAAPARDGDSAPASIGINPNGPEVEPNDDFDTASAIAFGAKRGGTIDRPGDVDFFVFQADPFDIMRIDWRPWGSPIKGVLTLYDENRVVLEEVSCAGNGICLERTLMPPGGELGRSSTFYLKVASADGRGGPAYTYYFTFDFAGMADENEPNDSMATATPLVFGEEKIFAGWPEGDVDYFQFSAVAGEELRISWRNEGGYNFQWRLVDANNVTIAEGDGYGYAFIPASGQYYLEAIPLTTRYHGVTVSRLGMPEPNDTPAQALPIVPGDDTIYGVFRPCDDVDYFKFIAQPGDDYLIEGGMHVQVLDEDLNVIIDSDKWSNSFIAQEADLYYLRLANKDESCEEWTDYYLGFSKQSTPEPNDSVEQAYPIAYDQTVTGNVSPSDTSDYFSFNGRAGDDLLIEKPHSYQVRVILLDAQQNVLGSTNGGSWESFRITLPNTAAYYLQAVYADWWGYARGYEIKVNQIAWPIYFSLNKSGTLQGVHFTAGDVLRYSSDTGRIEMVVDMSDLGLSGNLTSLGMFRWCQGETGTMFFGFGGTFSRAGLGTVTSQDLVRFEPTSLGANTAGTLSVGFDGSDVGLTGTSERLDAAGGDECPSLFLSTMGRAQVPFDLGSLIAADEDVLRFYGVYENGLGPDTGGRWDAFFDGSALGLGAADLVGADETYWDSLTGKGYAWFSFDRAVTISGISFAPGDIAQCTPSWVNGEARCLDYHKLFDASEAGLGAYRIDAFEVGQSE